MSRDAPAEEVRREIGRLALAADRVPERERRAIIEARLPRHEWPDQLLRITAIDAESGAFVVFDRSSGVSLVDAVAASCAIPVVWPAVTIGGRRYIDGGMRSGVNADVALHYDRVLVIEPLDPARDQRRRPARTRLGDAGGEGGRGLHRGDGRQRAGSRGTPGVGSCRTRPSGPDGRARSPRSGTAVADASASPGPTDPGHKVRGVGTTTRLVHDERVHLHLDQTLRPGSAARSLRAAIAAAAA